MFLALNYKNSFPLSAQHPAIPRKWGLNQESAGQATFLSCCHFLAVSPQPAFCHHLHLCRATAQMWERLLGKDSVSLYCLAYLCKSYLRAGKQSNVPAVPMGTHGKRNRSRYENKWTHTLYFCPSCWILMHNALNMWPVQPNPTWSPVPGCRGREALLSLLGHMLTRSRHQAETCPAISQA